MTQQQNYDSNILHVSVLELARAWLDLMKDRSLQKAESLTTEYINNHRKLFKQFGLSGDNKKTEEIYICLILAKTLQDYTQLSKLTRDKEWALSPPKVEDIWNKFCDCKQRLDYISEYCRGECIEKIYESLCGLEFFFEDQFGEGDYLSPGIVSEKYVCSVCEQDIRSCSHISGRFYGGKICKYTPIDPRVDHIALVKIPVDPRCRIWPWHIQDASDGQGLKLNAVIMTTFGIDDFLD